MGGNVKREREKRMSNFLSWCVCDYLKLGFGLFWALLILYASILWIFSWL